MSTEDEVAAKFYAAANDLKGKAPHVATDVPLTAMEIAVIMQAITLRVAVRGAGK